MNTVNELLSSIESAGGRVWLEGDAVRCKLPRREADALVESLRLHRDQVVRILSAAEVTNTPAGENLIPGWIEARCTRPDDPRTVWGSEKSLWLDYCDYCDQREQKACARALFCEILNQCFKWNGDDAEAGGWQGICLADPEGEVISGLDGGDCRIHGAAATWWHREDGSAVWGLCHPDPFTLAVSEMAKGGPPVMPEGVRLVAWEPKAPPVQLSLYSVVNDPERFIATTLQQLAAALRGRSWAAGNWSPRDLIERLEQCGVRVEVQAPKAEGTR